MADDWHGPQDGENLPLGRVAPRVTIQDGVHQQLRHALMTGRFDPGQTLTIASLADTFGTSHMPVREALRRLAAENAVEISRSGTACVPTISVARLDDLCQARIVNEAAAASLAAQRMGSADIALLENNIREHRHAGIADSVYTMLGKNMEFHFYIYRRSGSDILVQIIESLWLRFGPYMRTLSTNMEPLLKTDYSTNYTAHHDTMIAALKAGDHQRFRDAMVSDIEATYSLVRDYCIAP